MKKYGLFVLFLCTLLLFGCGHRGKEMPVEPTRKPMIGEYADALDALCSYDGAFPMSAEAADAILSEYGYGISQIGALTDGLFREDDFACGRITEDYLELLKRICKNTANTYAIEYELYELKLKRYRK